jgi:hypothetical protein
MLMESKPCIFQRSPGHEKHHKQMACVRVWALVKTEVLYERCHLPGLPFSEELEVKPNCISVKMIMDRALKFA